MTDDELAHCSSSDCGPQRGGEIGISARNNESQVEVSVS
jgi:hypothetical protein